MPRGPKPPEPKRMKSISKTCKLFENCPFNHACLEEIKRFGFTVWSVELCYDLKQLIDLGLVKKVDPPEKEASERRK